jgi:metal-sulfur cluster biosynthetic enzyme
MIPNEERQSAEPATKGAMAADQADGSDSTGKSQPASTDSEQPITTLRAADLETVSAEQVKMALRKVKDPELNLNVVDLGLIYEVAIQGEGHVVRIDMSLTSPGCPSGPQIMGDVERVVQALDGVEKVYVNLVWEPFWTPERIEPRVRSYLGL